jgi:hypothetical protein
MSIGVRSIPQGAPLTALFIRPLGMCLAGNTTRELAADTYLEKKALGLFKSDYDIAIVGLNERPNAVLSGVAVEPAERLDKYSLSRARQVSPGMKGLVELADRLEELVRARTGSPILRVYDLIEAHNADAAMVAAILEGRRNRQLAANDLTISLALLSRATPASIGHAPSCNELRLIRSFRRLQEKCLAAWEASLHPQDGSAAMDPLEAAEHVADLANARVRMGRTEFPEWAVYLNLMGADEATLRKLRMAKGAIDRAELHVSDRVRKVVWQLYPSDGLQSFAPAKKAKTAARPFDWDLLRRFLLVGDVPKAENRATRALRKSLLQSAFLKPPDAIVAGAQQVRDLRRHFGRDLAMPAITVDPLRHPDYLEALDRALAGGAGVYAAAKTE